MTLLPTLGKRDLTIDAARGTALVSMFIAHAAPSGGPGDVLNLSEFLTAALFATLVGAGAQQSAWHRTPWAVTIVRGGSLIGVGLLLHELGAQVYIVLTQLGVLTVLAALLARCGSALVTVVGMGVGFSGSLALPWLRGLELATQGPERLLWYLTIGDSYRLTTMVLWAATGILFARAEPWLAARRRVTIASAAVLVALAGGFLIAKRVGWLVLHPYSGTPDELIFNAALSHLVLLTALLVATSSWRTLLDPLAAAGRMTLTLYAAHIVFLAAWVGPWGHPTDNSWLVLAALCLGAAVIVALWEPIWRRTGWRGPIEGVVHAASELVASRRRQPSGSAAS
ncbi:MAG: DUF418 domain-containing protein [Phycicoccus sp.]|nr:DUF418 domain-containing protein [Phycicoccus sp.]